MRPADACRELLPPGFAFDAGWKWLQAIQFGVNLHSKQKAYRKKQASRKELGFDSAEEAEKWRKIKELGIHPNEIIAQ